MVASSKGYMDMVKMLLEEGAEIEAKNNDGQTALDLAEKNGHTKVVDFLRKVAVKQSQK